MSANRLFYQLIAVALALVISLTACAPRVASTPISPTAASAPTTEVLPTNPTPEASPAVEAPPLEFKGHTRRLWGVAFSPDDKYLATGSSDKTARLWDLATGETIRIFSGHTGELGEVVFSPDGKYLLTGSTDKTARLWEVASGETAQIFSGHTGSVDSVAFSPDGKYIVTAGGGDKTARIWDVASGKTLHILTGHRDLVIRVAYSPDGKYVLTGSVDHTARLWDAATGSEIRVFDHPEVVGSIAFSPDSKTIATGGEDNVTRLWDVNTGELLNTFIGHTGFVQGVAFSPDGRFLLTGSADMTVRLWDLATNETIRVFRGHRADVQTVTFSPDGNLIATASTDSAARVWNLQASYGVLPDQSNPSAITLRLAVSDPGGSPSEPYVFEFMEQVQVLSGGDITIEPVWEAAGNWSTGDPIDGRYEVGVIQFVREGKFELGLTGSRAFDVHSITSFQTLQAPFLIDNDALSKAVATSDIATRMLDHLSSSGMTGLTLWPEDLRHPFSLIPGQPILLPEDFTGLKVRAIPSEVTYALIETLGGNARLTDSDYQAAESGLRQGASLTGTPTATGNVTFFAKYRVLIANGPAFANLSEDQRTILREAAAATQQKAITEYLSEADAASAWCADGGSIVLASAEQVAAFEVAAQPVFDMIAQDPLNAELIAAIRELKANTEPSPGAEACTP
jgi:TRAP-type C4-dicarboxylate transport system substrate-binding protein/sugar lactone lactonase YvrE